MTDIKESNDIEKELEQALLEELGTKINPALAKHVLDPQNIGILRDPSGEATVMGICEDTVRIQIRLKDDRIDQIRFMTNGCGATIACGSAVTEMAQGKSLIEAMRIEGETVNQALGGLPLIHTHCADLAANTLKEAVKDALKKKKDGWKQLYGPKKAE